MDGFSDEQIEEQRRALAEIEQQRADAEMARALSNDENEVVRVVTMDAFDMATQQVDAGRNKEAALDVEARLKGAEIRQELRDRALAERLANLPASPAKASSKIDARLAAKDASAAALREQFAELRADLQEAAAE